MKFARLLSLPNFRYEDIKMSTLIINHFLVVFAISDSLLTNIARNMNVYTQTRSLTFAELTDAKSDFDKEENFRFTEGDTEATRSRSTMLSSSMRKRPTMREFH